MYDRAKLSIKNTIQRTHSKSKNDQQPELGEVKNYSITDFC